MLYDNMYNVLFLILNGTIQWIGIYDLFLNKLKKCSITSSNDAIYKMNNLLFDFFQLFFVSYIVYFI